MVEEDTQALSEELPSCRELRHKVRDKRASDIRKGSKRSVKRGGLRRGRGRRTCLAPGPAQALPVASHRQTCLRPSRGQGPPRRPPGQGGCEDSAVPRPAQDPEGCSPRAQAARKAVMTLLAHSTSASAASSSCPDAAPRSRAATAARSPTTAACTCGQEPDVRQVC